MRGLRCGADGFCVGIPQARTECLVLGAYLCIQLVRVPRPSSCSCLACLIELFARERRRLNIRRIYSVGVGFDNYNSARIRSKCMGGQTNIISVIFAPVQGVAHTSYSYYLIIDPNLKCSRTQEIQYPLPLQMILSSILPMCSDHSELHAD